MPSSGFVLEGRGGASLGQTSVGNVASRDSTSYGNYGFWNNNDPIDLCFEISPDFWNIDSIDAYSYKIMENDEFIAISNCGNCNIQYGMAIAGTDTIRWNPAITPGDNEFSLRGIFNHESIAPMSFDISNDLITNETRWSTETNFGPNGYNMLIGETDLKLWLYFMAPNSSSSWGPNTIFLRLQGRYYIP